jgi:hypothetical protein
VTYVVANDEAVVTASDGTDDVWLTFDPAGGDNASIVVGGTQPTGLTMFLGSVDGGAVVDDGTRLPDADYENASVESAPTSATDVARKQEVDENATTIGGKADDPHGDGSHDETVPDFDSDVSEFSGAAGTADQVLQTDGTNASWADAGGGGGGPLSWVEDSNSPQSVTSNTILDYTMGDDWDEVRMYVDTVGSGDFVYMTINNVESDYFYIDAAGDRHASATDVTLAETLGSGPNDLQVAIDFSSRGNYVSFNMDGSDSVTFNDVLQVGSNRYETSLNSVQIILAIAEDISVRVFGRNL